MSCDYRFDEGEGANGIPVVQVAKENVSVAKLIEPSIKDLNVKKPKNLIIPEVESLNDLTQGKELVPTPRPLKTENMVASNLTPPTLKKPLPPEVEIPSSPDAVKTHLVGTISVIAKIDGVSLKNGPGPKFPEVGQLNKGDRLALIRKTKISFNGKPWLLVDLGGRKAYVWSDLVVTK